MQLQLFLSALAAMAIVGAQAAPPVTLDALLARAGAYEMEFEARFSNVVAEEHYVQQAPAHSLGPGRTATSITRTLVSDFLLVKVPSEDTWLPFRDVFEVDGQPVRNREDRLTKLFLQPAATAVQQAEQIVAESARYNIGIKRNINMPVLALAILRPASQPRFVFSHLNEDRKSGAGIWSIEYRERGRPTIVHTSGGGDLFAQGHLWIEASTGRVVKTEFIITNAGVRSTITTTFRFDSAFDLNVPAEMHEEYVRLVASGFTSVGTAIYSRFRRFTVEVDEKIRKDEPEP